MGRQDDDDLIRRALVQAKGLSARQMEITIGVSRSSISQWLEAESEGAELPELTRKGRDALRRFLSGPAARIESADYWRGVVAQAERQARAMADALAASLEGAVVAEAAAPEVRKRHKRPA